VTNPFDPNAPGNQPPGSGSKAAPKAAATVFPSGPFGLGAKAAPAAKGAKAEGFSIPSLPSLPPLPSLPSLPSLGGKGAKAAPAAAKGVKDAAKGVKDAAKAAPAASRGGVPPVAGVALGVLPFVVAPFAALAAARPLAIKAAAQREANEKRKAAEATKVAASPPMWSLIACAPLQVDKRFQWTSDFTNVA
jgi:hypothetical protein